MWVRGLKRRVICVFSCDFGSHPVWVRGLKLGMIKVIGPNDVVAPRVGAWIETILLWR